MNCPRCQNVALVMSERQGIEIDYCPTCRGVWLDRGELDKILERSVAHLPPPATPADGYRPRPDEARYRRDHRHDDRHYRRKSWLMELFD